VTSAQQAAAEVRVTPGPGAWLEALGAAEDRIAALERRVRVLERAVAELVADQVDEYPGDEDEEET
jgi:hypothetical protein